MPSMTVTAQEMYPIPLIYRSLTEYNIKRAQEHRLPTFNTQVIRDIVNFSRSPKTLDILYRLDYGQQASGNIRFIDNRKGWVTDIDFSDAFLHYMVSIIVKISNENQ